MLKTYNILAYIMLGLNSYGQPQTNDQQPRPDSLNQTLKTVTISASRPVIEQRADRIVFNVENSVHAAGSDAYELLRRTPGVQVNNGSITIAGKGSVSIMINDKLRQISGDELEAMLRSMPSDNISKIEVITTPPAKYDAAGNSGIINIITKKDQRRGLNGNIGSTYFQRHRPGGIATAGLNYRSKNWFIYGTAMVGRHTYSAFENNTTYYTQQKQEEHLVQINHAGYNSMEIGADYNVTPSSTIGISTVYRRRTRDVDQNYHTDVIQASGIHTDSILYTYANEPFNGSNISTSIDYNWKIDTGGKKLRLSADHFYKNNKIERVFNTSHAMEDGTLTGYMTNNHTAGDQLLSIAAVTADLDLPNKKWADLSVGVKASFIANSKDYFINTIQADKFAYSENTQAIYLIASRDWNKWQLKMGVRTEYTQTTGISFSTAGNHANSYYRVFPSGYLQYEIAKSVILHINYSRRIERPELDQLNPFRDFSTDVSYYTGNPFLQPYTTDNIEIGGLIKSNYDVRIYASHKQNFFTDISVMDNARKAYFITPVNTGDCWNYGIQFNTSVHICKNWELVPQFSGYYSSISSGYYNQTHVIITPSFNAEINNIVTINKSKTIIAEFGARHQSAQQRDISLQYQYSFIWGGLKIMMLNKRLIAALNFNDPFNGDYKRSENLYNHAYFISYYDRRNLNISVNWKFGNKDIKKTDKNNQISAETNRAGG